MAQPAVVSPLLSDLRSLKEKAVSLQGRRGLNEETTKAALIIPLLTALGWDTSDPEQVVYEYRRRPKDLPVDFALMLQRTPSLFVEAKSLGHDITDRKWTNQIISYATQSGVGWLVLTNGVDYHIYNAHAPVPLEGKLFRKLSLTETPVEELARELSLLSRADFAGRRIDRVWDAHHVDRQVHGLLHRVVHEEPEKLASLLARMSDGKVSKGEVRASLLRADVRVSFPPAPVALGGGPVTREKREKRKPKPTDRGGKGPKEGEAGKAVSLHDLITQGALKAPVAIVADYRGHRLTATITADGQVEFEGKLYDSASTAGGVARKPHHSGNLGPDRIPSTNGWKFWKVKDGATGEMVQLDVVRRRRNGR